MAPRNAVTASPPPSKATKRIFLKSTPAALAVSAAFIQSWLPTVPPAPSTILVGSCLKASIRPFRSVYGESLRTTATP